MNPTPPERPGTPRGGRAERDGIELAYTVRGSGPETVVLLIGLGSRGADWGPHVPAALAEHYQVIVVDNRGTGESSVPSPGYTLDDMAEDVVAVLDDAAVRRAHVVGLSMGGMIAQLLALDHADRVDRLVLINTHFGGQECVSPTERAGPIVRPQSHKGPRTDLETRTRENFAIVTAPGFAAAQPEVVDAFVARVLAQPTSTAGFLGQIQATVLSDRSQRVRHIDKPVLVVQSNHDEVSRPPNGEMLAQRIPGARLHMLPDSGHFAMWDQPEALARITVDFLGAG